MACFLTTGKELFFLCRITFETHDFDTTLGPYQAYAILEQLGMDSMKP